MTLLVLMYLVYQGSVDFNKVKTAGVTYVFIRATEGITIQDSEFKSNFASAQTAGLTVGAYHFYETNDDPIAQLDNFISVVTLKAGDLPPVIDIERIHNNDESNLIENIQKFLSGLESHYGVKPIIYSNHDFANEYLTEFGNYPLWLAEYEVSEPKLPNGWANWVFWQWSESSIINGVNGNVDVDRYNGDEASFQRLLIKSR